jgi:hypothetical protein
MRSECQNEYKKRSRGTLPSLDAHWDVYLQDQIVTSIRNTEGVSYIDLDAAPESKQ